MSDTWNERKKALEEEYFNKQNKLALERLNKKMGEPARISPVSGKAMQQEVIYGVVVDRCLESGGVWLDQGELEEIIKSSREAGQTDNPILNFFNALKK